MMGFFTHRRSASVGDDKKTDPTANDNKTEAAANENKNEALANEKIGDVHDDSRARKDDALEDVDQSNYSPAYEDEAVVTAQRNDVREDKSSAYKPRRSTSNASDEFGLKAHRDASVRREYKGDHIDVASHPYLMKALQKQGDKQVLFAGRVLKFTSTGKMKRRILVITDYAIYIVDPDFGSLKRRIVLAAVERIWLSELSDNFFVIIIPTEYDLLMASTRKAEIVTQLAKATKTASDYDLEVVYSNRFEYNATAELVKEVEFEKLEGGIRTRVLRK